MALVTFDRVHKDYGTKPLLDGVSLALEPDEKVGVIGANGAGKTTLLRLIAGEQPLAEGEIARTGTLGVLAQTHAPPPGASLADLLGVAVPLARLARIERGEGDEDDFSEADWELPERIAKLGIASKSPGRWRRLI